MEDPVVFDVVTADTLALSLHVLDRKAVKRLTKMLGKGQGTGAAVSCQEFVQIILADWLTHLGLFSDAQILAILQEFAADFAGYAAQLEKAEARSSPKFTFVVCEGRFVSCSGRATLFDADICEELEALPELAVTHIMCDVTSLYFRTRQRLKRTQKTSQRKDSTGDEQSAETADDLAGKEGRATAPQTLQQYGVQSRSPGGASGSAAG